MRPRQICRGMKAKLREQSEARQRFNEAPANLPGNAFPYVKSLAQEYGLQ